ncbi:hypothetical protein QUA08_21635, partial [Microcoleus sp. T3B2]|uniref:hypothetical protein n=2 Tax=unclassified Microcoleus TaxID=2642155 RepID=UPI002FD75863
QKQENYPSEIPSPIQPLPAVNEQEAGIPNVQKQENYPSEIPSPIQPLPAVNEQAAGIPNVQKQENNPSEIPSPIQPLPAANEQAAEISTSSQPIVAIPNIQKQENYPSEIPSPIQPLPAANEPAAGIPNVQKQENYPSEIPLPIQPLPAVNEQAGGIPNVQKQENYPNEIPLPIQPLPAVNEQAGGIPNVQKHEGISIFLQREAIAEANSARESLISKDARSIDEVGSVSAPNLSLIAGEATDTAIVGSVASELPAIQTDRESNQPLPSSGTNRLTPAIAQLSAIVPSDPTVEQDGTVVASGASPESTDQSLISLAQTTKPSLVRRTPGELEPEQLQTSAPEQVQLAWDKPDFVQQDGKGASTESSTIPEEQPAGERSTLTQLQQQTSIAQASSDPQQPIAQGRSLSPSQPANIQRDSDSQETEASPGVREQSSIEGRSLSPSQPANIQREPEPHQSQASITTEDVRPAETQTVAQLLSQPGATPQLPKVLENITTSQPLGITKPLIQRSEFLSETSFPETARIFSSDEPQNFSVEPAVPTYPSVTNIQEKSDKDFSSEVLKQSMMIQRQESDAPITDVPDSWSSIEELLGENNAIPSDPAVVQTYSTGVQQAVPRQQQQAISDIRTAMLLPPGIFSGTAGIHSLDLQQQPTSVKALMEKALQSRTKLEEKAAPRNAEPAQTISSSYLGVSEKLTQVTETKEEKKEEELTTDKVEILAREIYPLLRQRLEIERERHGFYYSYR